METTYKLKFYKLKSSGLSSFYDTNNWGKFEENLRGMGDMVWMIWHGITLKAKLWIHLDMTKVHHLKGLTSPYIVSYLHFLNLNNSLTLPKLLSLLKLGLIWCLPCFLPARFTWVLVYEIKTNTSHLYSSKNICCKLILKKLLLNKFVVGISKNATPLSQKTQTGARQVIQTIYFPITS